MNHIQRTPEHNQGSISVNAIKLMIAKWGWTTNVINIEEDYGEDLMLRIRAFEGARPLGRFFQIQIKSMGAIENYLLSDGVTISYPIETRHLSSWLYIPEPMLLVVYDLKNEKAFWTHIQEYILEELYDKNPFWENQKTVNIPIYRNKTFSDHLSTPDTLMSLKIYSIEALLREGLICIENGDDIQALKCFKHANRLKPDFATRFYIFTQISKLKINNKISYDTDLRNDSDLENYISTISLLDDYAELLICYENNRTKANFVDRLNYSCPLTFTTFIAHFLYLRIFRKFDKRLVKFDKFIANTISNFLQKEPKCFFVGNAHTQFLFDAGLSIAV